MMAIQIPANKPRITLTVLLTRTHQRTPPLTAIPRLMMAEVMGAALMVAGTAEDLTAAAVDIIES